MLVAVFIFAGVFAGGCSGLGEGPNRNDLSCYLLPPQALPAGWRLLPKESIGCKTPFWTENPQVSGRGDFIGALTESMFTDGGTVEPARLGLMAGYQSRDGEREVLVVALLFDSEAAATRTRTSLQALLEQDRDDLHVVRQDGKAMAVMTVWPDGTGPEWVQFRRDFQRPRAAPRRRAGCQ